MENKEFHQKVDNLFESNLKCEEIDVIRVKNIKENRILEDINYGLLLFDYNLNTYKWDDAVKGFCVVNNPNFKAVIVKKIKK